MSATPEHIEVQAEISRLQARLTAIEDDRHFPGSRIVHPSEHFQRTAERQLKELLERRARQAAGADARELTLSATRREREGLEDRVAKIERDRDTRLAQLDRSREQIELEFSAQLVECRGALRELRERLEAEVAEAEARPVDVTLTPAQASNGGFRDLIEKV